MRDINEITFILQALKACLRETRVLCIKLTSNNDGVLCLSILRLRISMCRFNPLRRFLLIVPIVFWVVANSILTRSEAFTGKGAERRVCFDGKK